MIREDLRHSQRVEHYIIEALTGGEWKKVSEDSVTSRKRIVVTEPLSTSGIRIRLTDVRVKLYIQFIGVYG